MDEATARARLERLCAADQDPALTVSDIGDILSMARRPDLAGNIPTNDADASTWAAATLITAGTVIRVDSDPARYWRALNTGVTSATEPTWASLAGYLVGGSSPGYEQNRQPATTVDGSVTWADAGGDWAPTWDMDAAAAEGWRTKAARAAGRFDFGEDGQQFSRSQVAAHCTAMAERYEKRAVGSVRTPRAHAY